MIPVVVVMVSVDVVFPPAGTLTTVGSTNQQYVEHGINGVWRLTVPVNPLMLVTRIVYVAVAPGWIV